MRKIIAFIHEIGTIMYVGGILSHIVIGVSLGTPDPVTAYHVGLYKEISAYCLILPGLALKIIADVWLYRLYDTAPNWLKLKFAMTAFLTINAVIFLVPMMPELVALAKASLDEPALSQAFFDKAKTEELVGMSNTLPLIIELVLGAFKPQLGKERQKSTVSR